MWDSCASSWAHGLQCMELQDNLVFLSSPKDGHGSSLRPLGLWVNSFKCLYDQSWLALSPYKETLHFWHDGCLRAEIRNDRLLEKPEAWLTLLALHSSMK